MLLVWILLCVQRGLNNNNNNNNNRARRGGRVSNEGDAKPVTGLIQRTLNRSQRSL